MITMGWGSGEWKESCNTYRVPFWDTEKALELDSDPIL